LLGFDGSMGGEMNTQLVSNQKASRGPQLFTALGATLGSFAIGCVLGYSSPADQQLEATNSTANETVTDCGGPLSMSLTSDQIAWFGSSVNIGALIGAPIGGYLIKTIGRKTTLILSAIPFACGWGLIGTLCYMYNIII